MKELVEVIAKALVDHPEDVDVKSVDGQQVTVVELRVHREDLGKVIGRQGGSAIFFFPPWVSIEAAKNFRGIEVQVPLAERPPFPAGRYYVSDLIGCEVFQNGVSIGIVRDVQFPGGPDAPGTALLVIESSRGELLIPLAEDICTRIDTASRRIEVVLPEGLLDLNRT